MPNHPVRILLAAVTWFVATMAGPYDPAAYAGSEARLGVFVGLAIGLAVTRGLRAARRL
jgi:hypothetical protein